jgi:ferredoxin-NADP reductase
MPATTSVSRSVGGDFPMLLTDIPPLTLRLSSRIEIAEGVLLLEFECASGRRLPGWTPGAHLEIKLPSGLSRQYSLCGDPADRTRYEVGVLREDGGRGGSLEVHRDLVVGTELIARPPRNHFPLVDADDYLLIAGGIGITPIKAMVRELERRGVQWRLLYGGRSLSSMAFVDDMRALSSDRVSIVPQDAVGLLDVAGTIAAVGPGTQVYCCGPSGLLEAVTGACENNGIADNLHIERFTSSGSAVLVPDDDIAFEVEMALSCATVTVAPDQSILEACRTVRGDLDYSCMEGYCGSCETRVLEGKPEHRGTLMSPEEHDEEGTMLICVGRSRSPRLVLEL